MGLQRNIVEVLEKKRESIKLKSSTNGKDRVNDLQIELDSNIRKTQIHRFWPDQCRSIHRALRKKARETYPANKHIEKQMTSSESFILPAVSTKKNP